MKKGVCLLWLFFALVCAADIPQSVMLEAGNVRVRLDGKKRWNINRIEYQNEQLGTDLPNAHYGMTCRPHDFKYAVGSGHEETGYGEEVVSVKFYADGAEVQPKQGVAVRGKKLQVVKVSNILSLKVKYTIRIENDIIYEHIEAVSDKDMKLHHLYFFMHPWSPRITTLNIHAAKDTIKSLTFKSDHKFVQRAFVETAAFYDANAGIGAITTYRNVKGGKKMMRIIWDRPQYRKDYLCDYFMSDLPGGHVIAYEAETSFYRVNSNNIKSK
jgi:hypothetical protein